MKLNKNEETKTAQSPETPDPASENNFVVKLLLTAIFAFSFYIRGIIPLKNATQGGVFGFAMDDAVYHMRLVESTIRNFPTRIFYDAFTQYPYGQNIHWGPLFDQAIALLSIIIGLGAPSQETINYVGAFFPAVLGALAVFPVYIIGRELKDRKTGILAAFLIAIMPGQFLQRSVFGFTDNHVAETLLIAVTMMFLILSFKYAKETTITQWRTWEWAKIKQPAKYSVYAGLSLGAYLLTWTAGVFFVVVIAAFIFIQNIIEQIRRRNSEYLCPTSSIMFAVALVMILPYVSASNGFDSAYYSLLHPSVLFVGILVAIGMQSLSKISGSKVSLYAIYLAIVALIGFILLKGMLPDMYATTVGNIQNIFYPHTGGALTVAEAMPLTTAQAVGNFGFVNYFISYFALAILVYLAIKKSKPEHVLFFTWSIFVLAILFAQNRFAYYYAINVAILSALAASYILDWFGLDKLKSITEQVNVVQFGGALIVIALLAFIPSATSPYGMTMKVAPYGALQAGFYEWYFAMDWLRNNTPDLNVDYYAVYKKPERGVKYNYPSTAYSIMSWWDYGHDITYWGRRIPIANPFQAGIDGSATFLTAQSEEEGNRIMDALNSKYVITDAYMAYNIQPVFAVWNNDNTISDPALQNGGTPSTKNYYISGIQTSKGMQQVPGMKSFESMTGRLHIFDTIGLQRYRLIHETPPNPNALGAKSGNPEFEQLYKQTFNMYINSALPLENTGYVKIFEYVKGARITGHAPANTTVVASLPIKTNIGRTFTYSQAVKSDETGKYSFIVPYSNSGDYISTRFDTKATGNYTISIQGIDEKRTVEVTETDVVNGNAITV